jgi:hypothetical protein
MALVVFAFATQDTKKMELMYMDKGTTISVLSAPAQPLAAQ